MRTRWQAAPYIRRAREDRSLVSPAAILAALTLAVVACILISSDGGSAPLRYGDVELQTAAGGLPGTHAWGAYGRVAAVSRSAIGWLASVSSRARSLNSRSATSARTAHLWQAASRSVATTRLQQGVDLDPSSSNHPTDPIFDEYKADPLDRARIGTGYMVTSPSLLRLLLPSLYGASPAKAQCESVDIRLHKCVACAAAPHALTPARAHRQVCCVRNGHDEEQPAYQGYFGDFPHEPLCIPGYHEKSGVCEACLANQYCPTHIDYILTCPPQLMSLPGAQHETDCWCPPGTYGSPDARLEGGGNEEGEFVGSCLQCAEGHFCPGEIRAETCPPYYKVEECLQYPYSTRHMWPGAMLSCPPGSDTRGLNGMAYCECKPGYIGGKTTGGQDSQDCTLLLASSPGAYSPNGTVVIPCGNHTRSEEGATSFADCACLPGRFPVFCAALFRVIT